MTTKTAIAAWTAAYQQKVDDRCWEVWRDNTFLVAYYGCCLEVAQDRAMQKFGLGYCVTRANW
jgi:hypothetical protein